MRRLILAVLLALPLCGATGDILAVRVIGDTCTAGASCNGWVAEIDIEGLADGGAYAFGLDANNFPTAPKVIFSVTSPGFNSSGGAISVSRTVYGTYALRKPYPDQTDKDEAVADTTLTVRVTLSEPIYVADTATVDIGAGFYTEAAGDGGTANNAVSDMAVTVSSTLAYQKPVANWTCVNRTLVNTSLTLSAFGMSGTAANGVPLAAVQFSAADASAHTATATVSTMTKSTGMAVDFYRYVATLDISGFTTGDLITANFKAYPRLGQAAAVFDSNDNAALGEATWLPAPIFFVKGTNATFGSSYAFVDPVSGNDDTCAVSNDVDTARKAPCLTIGAAEQKTRTYNLSNYSRENLANSNIYLQNGTYASVGGSFMSYSATGDTVRWTLTKAPEAQRANVIIQTNAAAQLWGMFLRVTDITLARDANMSVFVGAQSGASLQVDNCTVTDSLANWAPLVAVTSGKVEFWQNTYTNIYETGGYWFIGNTVTGAGGLGYARTQIGNSVDAAGQGRNILTESIDCDETSDGTIIYNNIFTDTRAQINLASSCAWSLGGIVAQNLMEVTTVTGEGPAIVLPGGAFATNNILLAYNTVAGYRINLAYNDTGILAISQANWLLAYNMTEYIANKGDLNAPENGARTGNWPVAFGVNSIGNIGAGGDGEQEWLGLWSSAGTAGSQLALGYVDDQSESGGDSGGGDYHLTGASPALNRVASGRAMLPYDISGVPRRNDGTGAVGAYEYQSGGRRRTPLNQ